MQAKPPLMTALLMATFVLLMRPAAPAEDGKPQPGPDAEETEQQQAAPAATPQVRMAEFRINDRRVVGRLIDENEESVKVRIPGSGTITFAREHVRDLKSYAVSRVLYQEKLGDYHIEQTWDFKNDERDYANALKAYLQGIAASSDGERKERLRNKYRGASEQRRAWQEESMRREKLAQARAQTEAARLQEELARKKLDEFEALAKAVRELRSDADALYEKISGFHTRLSRAERNLDRQGELIQRNRRSLHRLYRDMEWLKDEVDDLEDHFHHRHH